MNSATKPFESVTSAEALGQRIRQARKTQKLRLVEAAGLSGVSIRFFSELENGRGTCSFNRVFRILQTLGLDLYVQERG